MESAAPNPIKDATIPEMTTVRAEHGSMVTSTDAITRSRRVGSRRVLMIAGTLHPKDRTMGIRP